LVAAAGAAITLVEKAATAAVTISCAIGFMCFLFGLVGAGRHRLAWLYRR
jgi:hypothetical protein